MKRPCYNMVTCEMNDEVIICIQTLDGMLAFYDMNKMVCSMQVKNFIIPGPIIFVPELNYLILQNSSYQLQAFKYENVFAKGSTMEAAEGIKPD